jgi:hypothetical protein
MRWHGYSVPLSDWGSFMIVWMSAGSGKTRGLPYHDVIQCQSRLAGHEKGFAMLAVFLALAIAISFGGSNYVAGLAAGKAAWR